ncbi:MAG: lysine--tRNA ligase [bacterium]|nr:lysine--tRNA ligase [bacterium]
MFWVDEVVDEILKASPGKQEFILRDEKTLSGRVHVGSLRGVVIHGVVAQALNERGVKARFLFEFNDVDPMDSLPGYLDQTEYAKYMGMPLRDIPSPDGKAKNFAEYWGQEFLGVINGLGFQPEIIRASQQYDSGLYDPWIEKVIRHPAEIRAIYREVSGSEKPEDWYPLQVICERCGKVGTTKVTGVEENEVTYVCEPDMVRWAKGCGNTGKVSPYGGRGKLPWKVEWPVKWAGMKVDIEGSGKDHCAAGGSRDIGVRICKEILEATVPYSIPYEFFLFEGAKMSSSKGSGSTAKEVFDSLPPELLRFMMVRARSNQPIEFKLTGGTIPRLYDQYDETAEHFFGKEKPFPDLDRVFHFSQIAPEKLENNFRPRFGQVSFLTQMPHVDFLEEVKKLKGEKLTAADKAEADNRKNFAVGWLKNYASEEYLFELQQDIPESAHDLSSEQKDFLRQVSEVLADDSLQDESLHARIHELRKASPLEAREAFSALYSSLLGKTSGPQVGWFFSALDRTFLRNRFKAVSLLEQREKKTYSDVITPLIVMKAEAAERLPGIKTAWALVEGVKIEGENPELSRMIGELTGSTDFQSLKESSEKLKAFKDLYKAFGVDPSKRKPSPVALIDRLAKGKPFPHINVIVDLYNYLTIKHQFSLGAFNRDNLSTPISLRFSKHSDQFQGIGTDRPKKLEEGELCFFDANDLCLARDFNHYDSELTKADESMTNVLLNVDGSAAHRLEELKLVMEEFQELVLKFCGGTVKETFYLHHDK